MSLVCYLSLHRWSEASWKWKHQAHPSGKMVCIISWKATVNSSILGNHIPDDSSSFAHPSSWSHDKVITITCEGANFGAIAFDSGCSQAFPHNSSHKCGEVCPTWDQWVHGAYLCSSIHHHQCAGHLSFLWALLTWKMPQDSVPMKVTWLSRALWRTRVSRRVSWLLRRLPWVLSSSIASSLWSVSLPTTTWLPSDDSWTSQPKSLLLCTS